MDIFKVKDREVGPEYPPLVLVEVGINHEGELEKALQCVDAAAEAGAEVVKFQCHITEKEMLHTDMKPGDILEILGDCPMLEKNVRIWCERLSKVLLSVKDEGAKKKRIQIQF